MTGLCCALINIHAAGSLIGIPRASPGNQNLTQPLRPAPTRPLLAVAPLLKNKRTAVPLRDRHGSWCLDGRRTDAAARLQAWLNTSLDSSSLKSHKVDEPRAVLNDADRVSPVSRRRLKINVRARASITRVIRA